MESKRTIVRIKTRCIFTTLSLVLQHTINKDATRYIGKVCQLLLHNIILLLHSLQPKGQFIVILSIWSRILRSITLIQTQLMHLLFVPVGWWRNYTLFNIAYHTMSNTSHFRHQTTGTKNIYIDRDYIKVIDHRIWDRMDRMTMNWPLLGNRATQVQATGPTGVL